MLSVIICTYNREKYLFNVLKSIADNDFPVEKYEIILINNNCTDNTEIEYHRFQTSFPNVNLRYFIEKKQGLSYARNLGISEAKGEILIYVDDDATVNKVFLSSYASFFEHNKNAYAAGGPVFPIYETKKPAWISHFTKNLITGYLYFGKKIIEFKNGKYPAGGNAAYRKEIFDSVGLYNVNLGRSGGNLLGGEEKDIFDKMRDHNLRFFYLPTPVLYHMIPETKLSKDYFYRLTYSIGKSERRRTLDISETKYFKRLILETIKWGVTLILFIYYTLSLSPQKGLKLIHFRWNVSKGLLGK